MNNKITTEEVAQQLPSDWRHKTGLYPFSYPRQSPYLTNRLTQTHPCRASPPPPFERFTNHPYPRP
jgi:hypothetical protein